MIIKLILALLDKLRNRSQLKTEVYTKVNVQQKITVITIHIDNGSNHNNN